MSVVKLFDRAKDAIELINKINELGVKKSGQAFCIYSSQK